MTHDPKLVEAVARALALDYAANPYEDLKRMAAVALDAIRPPHGVSQGEALAYRSMPEFPGKKGG